MVISLSSLNAIGGFTRLLIARSLEVGLPNGHRFEFPQCHWGFYPVVNPRPLEVGLPNGYLFESP